MAWWDPERGEGVCPASAENDPEERDAGHSGDCFEEIEEFSADVEDVDFDLDLCVWGEFFVFCFGGF